MQDMSKRGVPDAPLHKFTILVMMRAVNSCCCNISRIRKIFYPPPENATVRQPVMLLAFFRFCFAADQFKGVLGIDQPEIGAPEEPPEHIKQLFVDAVHLALGEPEAAGRLLLCQALVTARFSAWE